MGKEWRRLLSNGGPCSGKTTFRSDLDISEHTMCAFIKFFFTSEVSYNNISFSNQELEKGGKATGFLHSFCNKELTTYSRLGSCKEQPVCLHHLSVEVRPLLQEDCFMRH